MKLEEKFLVFACFVLLIALAYFLFTTNKEQTLIEEPQKPAEKSGDTSGGHVVTDISPKPKPKDENLEPTAQEWQVFEEVLKDREASEAETEVASDTDISKAESPKSSSSPELEVRFRLIYQYKILQQELKYLDKESREINQRRKKLIADVSGKPLPIEQLTEVAGEYDGLSERLKTLQPIIDSYIERGLQIENEFQQKHGMSLGEFYNGYEKDYNFWKSDL